MARVVITSTALDDLREIIGTHSLPANTTARMVRSLRDLSEFPELGPVLEGRWAQYRYLLGPWRWMIVIYEYVASEDLVAVVAIQDARRGSSPTADR